MRFRDRIDAGAQLAARLVDYTGRPDVTVLALPRGGVPVAAVVASKLALPLDVFLVRKIGVPGQPELAMGAVAEGGIEVLNESIAAMAGVSESVAHDMAARARSELDVRGRQLRQGRPRPSLAGRTVILVDDGLATGATMEAAVAAVRAEHPLAVVVAAPVGAQETCARLARIADRVVCISTPERFNAVGLWYEDFSETTDAEVQRWLASATAPGSSEQPPGNTPR